MNTALSSIEIEKKVIKFESIWGLIDEKKLYQFAIIDEVSSHIADVLKNTNIKQNTIWKKDHRKVEKRITCLMNELENVAQLLSEENIKIVALKNVGIAKGIYNNFACSPMGDIDLLVKSEDFKKAHHIIINDLDFIFKFRSEFENEDLDKAFRSGGTEYYKFVKGYKIWLELQWRPIAGRWIQPHNEPNGDELIDRSISVKGSAVRILSPEDNLLQVSLHTAKHSYVRSPGFRLHSDVDRVVRFQKINWSVFVNMVLNKKLKTAVYFSLYYAMKLLNTPIPGFVFKNLKPKSINYYLIQILIRKAKFYNQNNKKFSKISYIGFNLLLYDSLVEILKAIFPPSKIVKQKYDVGSNWSLLLFYVKRVSNLLFQRAKL
jgi:hypothetical protein